MNDLYFLGMNIIEEVKIMANFTTETCTDGMTESELAAYKAGVSNVMSALKALLDDDIPIVNIDNIEIPTELTIEELEDFFNEDM